MRNRVIREFRVNGVAVKMEFKCDLDSQLLAKTGQIEHINKRFEGMIQLDVITNGDFSDFDEEGLNSLLIAYFQNNRKIMIPDFLRKINGL